MAMSKGQAKGEHGPMANRGHSAGHLGHGGHHRKHFDSIGSNHKHDHMRSMIGRSAETMNGPQGAPGGPGMIGDSGMGMSGMPM